MKKSLMVVLVFFVGNYVYAQPTSYPASAGVGGNATNSYYGNLSGTSNTADHNTFIGAESGQSNTFGVRNSFLGYQSGFSNLVGQNNSYFGYRSGAASTGSSNAFFGSSSGQFTTSSYNTFFGASSGMSNTTGDNNVFFGASSGMNSTTGNGNLFAGAYSGIANTTGGFNVFLGLQSGFANTTGSGSVFVGTFSGSSNTTGTNNTFVGHQSGSANLSGTANTFLGRSSGTSNNLGSLNTFIGDGSGAANSTGDGNTFVGSSSGLSTTNGSFNVFVGQLSGAENIIGGDNTYLGRLTGQFNTSGIGNVFIGSRAGQNSILGSDNVFIGSEAGMNETGSSLLYISNNSTDNPLIWGDFANTVLNLGGNVGVGLNPSVEIASARLDVNGNARIRVMNEDNNQTRIVVSDVNGNLFYRDESSFAAVVDNLGNHIATLDIVPDANGSHNLGAVGLSFHDQFIDGSIFIDNLQFLDNLNGNVSLGHTTLDAVTTGAQNISIGGNTSTGTTSGSGNVAVGFNALNSNTSGNNNTAIGTNAGPFTLQGVNVTNSTAIGYGARTSASNQVRVGNTNVTSIGGYAAWANLSDGRFKKNVKEDVSGLAFIEKLRPVSYDIEEEKLRKFMHEDFVLKSERPRQVGFIAQEVEEIVDKNGLTFSGVEKPASENEHYSLQYSQFVVPLTKAVQELSAMVKDQQKQIASLEKMLSAIDGSTNSLTSNTTREGFSLQQNHPNPFNVNTTIELTLPDGVSAAVVVIHDLRGAEMKRILVKGRGTTSVMLEGGELNAGMYLYSLVADGNLIDTKRMLLMD